MRRQIPPVSKLPDDLILEIVKHAVPEPFDGDDSRIDVLFTLSAINKQWREIVVNNTSLWTHHFVPNLANGPKGLHYECENFINNPVSAVLSFVCYGMSGRLVIALRRSGSQPLTFEFEFRHQPTLRFRRCWRVIKLCFLARCRRLSIISDDLDEPDERLISGLDRAPLGLSPWAWLGLPILVEHHFPLGLPENPWDIVFPLPQMPELIELEIVLGPEDNALLHNLFNEQQSRLRSVHLSGTLSTNWGTSFDYSALTNLHIAPRTSPVNIACVISRCSSLQRLFIEQGAGIEITQATSVYPDPLMPDIKLPRIHLGSLIELRVRGDAACVVASAITAPNLNSLEVLGVSMQYDDTGTIPPRYFLQLLRGGRYAHPALRYLSLMNVECSSPGHESMVASELVMFLTEHKALEMLLLDRVALLPHLITQVYEVSSTQKRKIYRNWRVLHIVTANESRRLCKTLPDFSPLLAGNDMLTIEFGDESQKCVWGEDEMALEKAFAPRVWCVDCARWDFEAFAPYWVHSRIGDWEWDGPMMHLEDARQP